MHDAGGRPPSIRRRLLIFLIVSLLLVVGGAAVATYFVALRSANNAYDRSLLDPVVDIAENVQVDGSGVRVDLPQKALEVLVFDQVDKVLYQVRSPSGEIVAGAPDLPPLPGIARGQHLFFDGVSGAEKVRIAATGAAGGAVVQVAETLHKRNQLVGEILLAELTPALIIALAASALAVVGVAQSLSPLERLRNDLLLRTPRNLRPLPESSLPVEIVPFVNAFNHLINRVRDANTMQQRFLANAAHQLRTPLAGLQMHVELLLGRDLPADVRSEVERMYGATTRASRLAVQLLTLAKAESALELTHRLVPVDLRSVVDSAARDWAPKAHACNIDLGFALEQAVISGDGLLLREVVDNLIDNALRYTPQPGTVNVRTGCEGNVPFLSVEDSGPGIPPDQRSKVLDRFYRMPGTSGEGSGLGLAIVKEVVDRYGGVVQITRDSELGGARVCISFLPSMAGSLDS